MTKQELLQRVIETVMQERKKAEESLATTRQAAIDAPGAMQSHSDTTKSQMSRLAEEIERSIEEKNFALRTLQGMAHSGLPSDTEVIKIGSVVEVLTERGEREIYFILPVGGGIEIVDNDRTITVATCASTYRHSTHREKTKPDGQATDRFFTERTHDCRHSVKPSIARFFFFLHKTPLPGLGIPAEMIIRLPGITFLNSPKKNAA